MGNRPEEPGGPAVMSGWTLVTQRPAAEGAKLYTARQSVPYDHGGRLIQLQIDVSFARPRRYLWWYYPAVVPAFVFDVVTFPVQAIVYIPFMLSVGGFGMAV